MESPPSDVDSTSKRPTVGRFILFSLIIGYGLYSCYGIIRFAQLGEAVNEGAVTALGFRAELNEIIFSVLVTGFCLSALVFPLIFGGALVLRRLKS